MTYNFEFDRAGFPMIYADSAQAYIHVLPVTKIQFEYFLCDNPADQFNEQWYARILSLNERVSARRIKHNNYWRTFITGLTQSEIERFYEWSGSDDEFRIPVEEEWRDIYREFSQYDSDPTLLEDIKMGERQKQVFKNIFSAVEKFYRQAQRPPTLAEQMLMNHGVLEWVENDYSGEWGGMGFPRKELHTVVRNPDDKPLGVMDSNSRMHYYGFRLLMEG